MWQAQSDEKVVRAISKWAPHHGESDLTGPKRQACTGDLTRAILCGHLQGKCRTRRRSAFCASLRSRNAHGHFTRAILCGNLQGKPDASPATSVLREPAQSKWTWTVHKSHFVWKFTGEIPVASPATSVLCEPAQSKWTWTVWKFQGKMPDASAATPVLCEPGQSTCTWTFCKSHFVWKFTRNWPDTDDTTSIEHRALTPTVKLGPTQVIPDKKWRIPIISSLARWRVEVPSWLLLTTTYVLLNAAPHLCPSCLALASKQTGVSDGPNWFLIISLFEKNDFLVSIICGHTHMSYWWFFTHTHIYIYIFPQEHRIPTYVYIYICVCVCKCMYQGEK